MDKKYQRLSLVEREEISRSLACGKTYSQIANTLGRPKSTVSREIDRCGITRWSYRAFTAHKQAQRLAQSKHQGNRISKNPALEKYIQAKLKLKWSPEQIASQLKIAYAETKAMQVSHETIYKYLYVLPRGTLRAELLACLRQRRLHRRKGRKNLLKTRVKINGMISIEERPKEVGNRIIPGHWEGDLLAGQRNQSAVGTLVERTTRFTFLVKLKQLTADSVRKAFAETFKLLPQELKQSLTYDQGSEMAQHKLFTKGTNITVYFAHPHCPWERGTNENTNGLIRQFFPKSTDFNRLTNKDLKYVQSLLNGRPRKVLNWRKPAEALQELVALER